MNKKFLLTGLFSFTLVIGAILIYSSLQINNSKGNSTITLNFKTKNTLKPKLAAIPENYYQDLDLKSKYVYNVSQFGGDAEWLNFSSGSEGLWSPNSGGQIIINFTGFYGRDLDDIDGDLFPDTNLSWLDVKIYKNTSIGQPLSLNYTQYNISNHEIAQNLRLGFSGFQSGFLLPINNINWIKTIAIVAAEGENLNATLKVELSYNFIYLDFNETSGGGQKTQLIYDRFSGLLIWANTSIGDYKLELFLTNYSLNYNTTYKYDVDQFGGSTPWYNFDFGYEGNWKTNQGGQIIINFTGLYNKDPNDWGNVFDDPIPWINIEIFENQSNILVSNFTLSNRSNSEAAYAMLLGFNHFQSGFLIHNINNLTHIMKLAQEEAKPSRPYAIQGDVSLQETNLTIKIKFDQVGGGQQTYLLYEKWTGLLLWTKTTIFGYVLEMGLIEQSAEFSGQPRKPPSVSRETESDEDENIEILDFTIPFVILGGSAATSLSLLFWKRNEKILKFLLTGIFGAISFTSLFLFNFWLYSGVSITSEAEVITEGEPQDLVTDITLIVEFRDDNVKTWTDIVLTGGDTSVLDALEKYCDVKYKQYDFGVFVEDIDGVEGNWLYKVNGEEAVASADNYYLDDGDVIEWYMN